MPFDRGCGGSVIGSSGCVLALESRSAISGRLYSGLAAEDAARGAGQGREAASDYRLRKTVPWFWFLPARSPRLRLQLAAAGVPKSGRIGFELFDKTNFGASDFAEQVNYHRALEGELERSVMSLAEVEQARVHITFAKDSIFPESRQPAKASVLVKLRAGAQLSPQNVAAICQLTASAVEGLAPEAVSVVDTRGNLLNRARKPLPDDGAEPSEAAIDYRQKIEHECWPRSTARSSRCSAPTSSAPAIGRNAILPAASRAKRPSIPTSR